MNHFPRKKPHIYVHNCRQFQRAHSLVQGQLWVSGPQIKSPKLEKKLENGERKCLTQQMCVIYSLFTPLPVIGQSLGDGGTGRSFYPGIAPGVSSLAWQVYFQYYSNFRLWATIFTCSEVLN